VVANRNSPQKHVWRHFENAFVLLSNDFRYLGNKETDDYKQRYLNIRALIENLAKATVVIIQLNCERSSWR
jgi:hypothetical protein